jgi:hypothetical protein
MIRVAEEAEQGAPDAQVEGKDSVEQRLAKNEAIALRAARAKIADEMYAETDPKKLKEWVDSAYKLSELTSRAEARREARDAIIDWPREKWDEFIVALCERVPQDVPLCDKIVRLLLASGYKPSKDTVERMRRAAGMGDAEARPLPLTPQPPVQQQVEDAPVPVLPEQPVPEHAPVPEQLTPEQKERKWRETIERGNPLGAALAGGNSATVMPEQHISEPERMKTEVKMHDGFTVVE